MTPEQALLSEIPEGTWVTVTLTSGEKIHGMDDTRSEDRNLGLLRLNTRTNDCDCRIDCIRDDQIAFFSMVVEA